MAVPGETGFDHPEPPHRGLCGPLWGFFQGPSAAPLATICGAAPFCRTTGRSALPGARDGALRHAGWPLGALGLDQFGWTVQAMGERRGKSAREAVPLHGRDQPRSIRNLRAIGNLRALTPPNFPNAHLRCVLCLRKFPHVQSRCGLRLRCFPNVQSGCALGLRNFPHVQSGCALGLRNFPHEQSGCALRLRKNPHVQSG